MLVVSNKIIALVVVLFSNILLDKSYTFSIIKVVAAEKFYADTASAIGGNYTKTASILNSPNIDPHLFAISAKTALAFDDAEVLIYNGLGYDSWVQQLLYNRRNNDKKFFIINTSTLMQSKINNNPHLWYDPRTFLALAKNLKEVFIKMRPEFKESFDLNYNNFNKRYKVIYNQLNNIKKGYASKIKVTATEPVFGYMSDALGFLMLGEEFQWAMMNNTEVSPRTLANYQDLLKHYKVKVVFYNQQVYNSLIKSTLNLADKYDIPCVGISETMPINDDIITWLLVSLINTQEALK